MPSRAELSLRDLKFAAGNIGFVEVVRERDRVRFKVKLLGGQLESFIAPLTGQFVDEAVPLLIASKWATMWTAVIEDRVPLRTVGLLEFRDQRWFVGETLFAPLAADGETPDALVVCCYFYLCDDPDAFGGGISERLIDQLGERAGRKRVIV